VICVPGLKILVSAVQSRPCPGRRTRLALPNGVSTDYQYDGAARLIALTYRNTLDVLGDLTYQYDSRGSRVKTGGTFARMLLPDPVTSGTYDSANRQLTFNDKQMSFDANGNVTSVTDSSGTATFSWDARNRLVALAVPGRTTAFSYDALGRRSASRRNGELTQYLHDGLDIVQELTDLGMVSYLRGLEIDEVYARDNAQYYLADGLGSTIALIDGAGAVVTSYTYDAYGRTVSSGASSPNPFQYTGRENDGSDLYYYRARIYAPTMGRFAQEDPIGFAGGINGYAYVDGNPLNAADPLGLFSTGNFVWHYYFGRGAPIDLAEVGLAEAFRKSKSVRARTREFRDHLAANARGNAIAECKGCTTGAASFMVQTTSNTTTDVTRAPRLFSVGNSTFFRSGGCSGSVNCTVRTYTYACTASFAIRDWFRDPLDRGFEVGGTPYRINLSWNEGFTGRGGF
jgi:RHS repeat-associated protein